MSEENKAVVRRFFEEAFNTGNVGLLDELVAAGAVDHDPQNPFPDARGPDGARKGIELYRSAFPDLRLTVEDQIAERDMVVTRWTGIGTQDGDLPDLPATHKRSTVAGITIDRLDGGKIAESWVCWDTLGMLQQLGAVPAPGMAHA